MRIILPTKSLKALSAAAAAVLIPITSANAATTAISDNFGDNVVGTNTDGTVAPGVDGTYSTVITDAANGSIGEAGGVQSYNPGTGNWTRSEFHSNNDFAFPSAGESITFSWTVNNIAVSTDVAGIDYRVQLNAISADRAQGAGSERWLVTEGALSLDLFFDASGDGGDGSVNFGVNTKSDDQAVSTDGTGRINTLVTDAGWDWNTTANTISLEVTDTGYTWSDSLGAFSYTETFADNPDMDATPAEFASGLWGFHGGQNNDAGRGTHDLTAFSVITVPEPTAPLLGLLAFAGLALRRRR